MEDLIPTVLEMNRQNFLALICALSLLAGCSSASRTVQTGPTKEEAIRVAKQLTAGMREKDALESVFRNGLDWDPSLFRGGDSFGWCVGYRLQDDYILMLRFTFSKNVSEDWINGDGVLHDALLQRRGKTVEYVSLKD